MPWFLLGAAFGLLVGALLSFVMGGPAWPYLLTLGTGCCVVAMVLFLRLRTNDPGPRTAAPRP